MLHIRRIKMDDSTLRGDKYWILFEEGELTNPLVLISDFDMKQLFEGYKKQIQEDGDE